jgi:hypothetical protein
MSKYEFLEGVNSFRGKKLKELTLESGGTPIRSFLVSTWRTGSTFFGDILKTLPENFYFYEPMLPFGVRQIDGPPDEDNATSYLRDLMNCSYDAIQRFKSHEWRFVFDSNTQLWNQCLTYPECGEREFLESFCRLFPLQTVKLLRLRLKSAGNFLRDLRWGVLLMLLNLEIYGMVDISA